jgi:hypothetical protein
MAGISACGVEWSWAESCGTTGGDSRGFQRPIAWPIDKRWSQMLLHSLSCKKTSSRSVHVNIVGFYSDLHDLSCSRFPPWGRGKALKIQILNRIGFFVHYKHWYNISNAIVITQIEI